MVDGQSHASNSVDEDVLIIPKVDQKQNWQSRLRIDDEMGGTRKSAGISNNSKLVPHNRPHPNMSSRSTLPRWILREDLFIQNFAGSTDLRRALRASCSTHPAGLAHGLATSGPSSTSSSFVRNIKAPKLRICGSAANVSQEACLDSKLKEGELQSFIEKQFSAGEENH